MRDLLGKCARTLEFTITRREGVFLLGIASAAETTSFSTKLSCFSGTERRLVWVLACSPVLPHIAASSHREPVGLQFFCSAFDLLLFRAAKRASAFRAYYPRRGGIEALTY